MRLHALVFTKKSTVHRQGADMLGHKSLTCLVVHEESIVKLKGVIGCVAD